MKAGQLKFFSIGTVAENKALDSNLIEVTPLEVTPMVDGELTANATTVTSKGEDSTGAAYHTEVTAAGTIEAEWFPMGTHGNYRRSPDVRRGAIVAIYQFANQDKYYWVTLMDDTNLRRLETVIWGISATNAEGVASTADNMYFFEISSHAKLVHFHTSQANGEPVGYDVQFDLTAGIFSIRDTLGNIFNLDSQEHRMEMINVDGSFIDMNKTILKMYAADEIDVNTKAYNLTCSTQTIKADTSTQTSTTNTITATTTHKGNFSEVGNLAIAGNVSGTAGPNGGGGEASFEQALSTKATFSAAQGGTFGGTVQANKVVSTQPIEAPNV